MKKFSIQLDELFTRLKDRVEDMCQEGGEENGDYYNQKMLENKNNSHCVNGYMVRFINENIIIAEDGHNYNLNAMDTEELCSLVDDLAEMYEL